MPAPVARGGHETARVHRGFLAARRSRVRCRLPHSSPSCPELASSLLRIRNRSGASSAPDCASMATSRGQNIQFEFRSADGQLNLLRELADELVRLKVDIIVASQTPAVIAARQATTEIPIVMAPAGDPVATGLISSLARPGGNITGLSGTAAELGAKTLELLRRHAAVHAACGRPGQCSRSILQAFRRTNRARRPHPGHRNPNDHGPRRGGVRRSVCGDGQRAGGCRHGAGESPAQTRSRSGGETSSAGRRGRSGGPVVSREEA